MAKADPEELMNAYDNTIVYTDYLLHSVIEMLRGNPERRSCMIFVSDHGESLGGKSLYARRTDARRPEGTNRDPVHRVDLGRGAANRSDGKSGPISCLPQHPVVPRDRKPRLRRIRDIFRQP